LSAQQEALPFEWSERRNLESFIVAACNESAFEGVRNPDSWSGTTSCIMGGAASGKTHLAEIFRELHKAEDASDAAKFLADSSAFLVIDDADRKFSDRAAQENLFHLLNGAASRGTRLLLTCTKEPAEWVVIPDLLSRVQAMPKFFLDNPDDEMVHAAYQKLFMDRGVVPDEATLKYLVSHTERGFAKIRELVRKLDQAALADGKRLTRPYVGKILPSLLN
jgi:chromosomal replication initiation ATPase DnaA